MGALMTMRAVLSLAAMTTVARWSRLCTSLQPTPLTDTCTKCGQLDDYMLCDPPA